MSLTSDRGNIVFQCDAPKCRETLETNTSNFESARNLLRRAGWAPFKPPGELEWSHRCRACALAAAGARR